MIQFEDLKITTMTLIFELDGSINKLSTFHLLPITKINIKPQRESNKCKLPYCGIHGAIISLRYRNSVRGIIKNTKKNFKNAVTVDICTSLKNLSLKISPNTIQLCGAMSRENGIEAVQYVLNYLNDIKLNINYIQQHPEEYQEHVAYLKENSKGELTDKVIYDCYNTTNGILYIEKTVPDYFIKPVALNTPLMNFLWSLTNDQLYYQDYTAILDNLIYLKPVYNEDLGLKSVNEVMVNYNYNLGFKVNRDQLHQLIDNRNGFYSHYDNALNNSVTVELPYDDSVLVYKAKKKKKKIAHHTFLIYSSGAVTQSGPCLGHIMKEAYELFIQTIDEIKPLIML